MAKFPEPPDSLHIPPSIKVLAAGTLLWRVYFAGGDYPVAWNTFRFFGPTPARFDHHEPPPRVQKKGILYGAASALTCLAEVFQATRVIDRHGRQPWLVGFTLLRNVRLLDLTGAFPTRAGASMALNTGPRPRARSWSRLFYATYEKLEGLYYPSSMHGNQPSVALYERSQDALSGAPVFHRALADAALAGRLGAAAMTLGYRIV